MAFVAPLDVHVLLTGETGTGKSQLARLIHGNGPRATYPFVALNCAALPEALLESELFGALPGAHSTATRRIEGKVESAERGTTTNMDLPRAITEKRFREDLFYRLQVLPIRVPSLAERRSDIPLLAAQFCAQACDRHGLARLVLSPNALRALEAAEWPGNVRQLEHVVEAAVIRAAGEHARRSSARTSFRTAPPFPSPTPSRSSRRPGDSRRASCAVPSSATAGTWSRPRAGSISDGPVSTA